MFMSKILIVEDNEGIVSFLKTELELEDFSVCMAGDGRAALEAFACGKSEQSRYFCELSAKKNPRIFRF